MIIVISLVIIYIRYVREDVSGSSEVVDDGTARRSIAGTPNGIAYPRFGCLLPDRRERQPRRPASSRPVGPGRFGRGHPTRIAARTADVDPERTVRDGVRSASDALGFLPRSTTVDRQKRENSQIFILILLLMCFGPRRSVRVGSVPADLRSTRLPPRPGRSARRRRVEGPATGRPLPVR